MRILIGTSGFGYKEWRGHFYPEDLSSEGFLGFYAQHFEIVEINNTFYRMPKRDVLEKWADQVPESFTFVIKASRRITHGGRLGDVDDSLAYMLKQLDVLGPRLGPLLFQMPPQFPRDLDRLRAFVQKLPKGSRSAFEFRHSSWLTEETAAVLGEVGAVLVVAEGERPRAEPPLFASSDWGYLRLHRFEYSDDELRGWARRILTQPWREAYVFFKHEDQGQGPKLAKRFATIAAAGAGDSGGPPASGAAEGDNIAHGS